jgi:hypothetical protein
MISPTPTLYPNLSESKTANAARKRRSRFLDSLFDHFIFTDRDGSDRTAWFR